MINTYLTSLITEKKAAAVDEKMRIVARISANPEKFLQYATAKNVAVFAKAELFEKIYDAIQDSETDESVIRKVKIACDDAMNNAVGQIGYSNGAGMTAPYLIEMIHGVSNEFVYFAEKVEAEKKKAK